MKKAFCTLLTINLMCYFSLGLFAQNENQSLLQKSLEPGGGNYEFGHAECVSNAERNAVLAIADANLANLKANGNYQVASKPQAVLFSWPIRKKAGLTDLGFYGISNYVDENSSSLIKDYNCGNRSYNGHLGTDIAIWPFPWTKMANNDVEVIAAASGTIVYKADGNFDQQCAWNSGAQGNAIIIQHSDGTRSLYWHFKKNTLTSKTVGSTVAIGEFLGVVGSSGISTGPHLHFEVANSGGQARDPWGGACNNMGGQSLWQSQQAYWSPQILKLMTHSAAPQMPQCPPEVVNASSSFIPGQVAYFASYFRDRQANTTTTYTIKKPDGSVWQTWTHAPTTTYSLSWWHWNFILPTNAPAGTWTFQASLQGQTAQILTFQVISPCTAPTTSQISATNITSNSASMNCSLSGVSKYDWRYRIYGSSNWTELNSTSSSSVNLSGLSSGTTYEFQVGVLCSSGQWSVWSASKTFTTGSLSCAAPIGLYTSSITQNTAALNWNIVPNISNYTVQFYINGVWTSIGTSGSNLMNVYGLVPNSSYQWRVITNCLNGQQSVPSSTATFYTPTIINCSGGSQYPSYALTPNGNWQYQPLMWGGKYCLMNVTAGTYYTLSFCSIDGGYLVFDGEISIRSTADQLLSYNDDVCFDAPKLSWQSNFTGQVRVLLTKYNCAAQASNSTLAYRTGVWFGNPSGQDRDESAWFEVPTEITNGVLGDIQTENTIETAAFTVSPNPSAGIFQLSFNNSTPIENIRVLDPMGRIVFEQSGWDEKENAALTVDGSAWAHGVYFIQIKDQHGKFNICRVNLVK